MYYHFIPSPVIPFLSYVHKWVSSALQSAYLFLILEGFWFGEHKQTFKEIIDIKEIPLSALICCS